MAEGHMDTGEICEDMEQDEKDEENRIKFYLEAFEPYVRGCLTSSDLKDLILHYKGFDLDERKRLSHEDKKTDAELFSEIVTAIRNINDPLKYTALAKAFKEMKHEKVYLLLTGATFPDNDTHEKVLYKCGVAICQRLDVDNLLPSLIAEELISDQNRQIIEMTLKSNGKWNAAYELWKCISKRRVNWYTPFMEILLKNQQKDLANIIDKELRQMRNAGAGTCVTMVVNQENNQCMTTLAELFATPRSMGPHTKPLRLKVVARGQVASYQDKQCLSVALADGTKVIHGMCYEPAHYQRLAVGNTVMARNVILKREDDQSVVVLTRNTKVFLTTAIDTPANFIAEGKQMLNRPAAELKSLAIALQSPSKKKVSIIGKIVQEDEERTVPFRGDDIPIKAITLEDTSGRARVTMWRKTINRDVRPGDYVLVTDAVTNTFRNKTTLSTTARSKVEKTEVPVVTEEVTVIGVSLDGNGRAELLCADDVVLGVPADLLLAVAPDNLQTLEMLTDAGPVNLHVTKRGCEVSSIANA